MKVETELIRSDPLVDGPDSGEDCSFWSSCVHTCAPRQYRGYFGWIWTEGGHMCRRQGWLRALGVNVGGYTSDQCMPRSKVRVADNGIHQILESEIAPRVQRFACW